MRWLLVCIAWLPLIVLADSAERARIAAERQLLIERYAQQERDCSRRFAVTACIEDVRGRRRIALAPLRARELQLDDAERQQAAAERRAAIDAKKTEQAQRPPPPAPEVRQHAPVVPASAASAARRRTDDRQARAAQAAARAQAAQRRLDAAELTRQRIEKRLAERQAAGKTAAPLPASAPAR